MEGSTSRTFVCLSVVTHRRRPTTSCRSSHVVIHDDDDDDVLSYEYDDYDDASLERAS